MWTLHTANPEHWVPISTVASFKRMRTYTSLGTEWVAKALQLSEDLEVDETNSKVRRRTEVQEPKDQFARSVYAVRLFFPGFLKVNTELRFSFQKGFGDENPGLQLKLEEFFEKYGRTNAVRMRRDEDKKFKVRPNLPDDTGRAINGGIGIRIRRIL